MGYGHRVALLPAINLSQLSEFSLVIASLGLALGHIDHQLVSLLIMMFVITSTTSTYMIQFSHPLSQLLGRMLTRLRVHDIDIQEARSEGRSNHTAKRVVFLGFFREASSALYELERLSSDNGRRALLDEVLVIDFNPEVHAELRRRGIHGIYGDIAHMATLFHAEIHHATLLISTIPDAISKHDQCTFARPSTTAPHAKVIVTAESIRQALDLYQWGADYVLLPRGHLATLMAEIIEKGLGEGLEALRVEETARLAIRNEVIP